MNDAMARTPFDDEDIDPELGPFLQPLPFQLAGVAGCGAALLAALMLGQAAHPVSAMTLIAGLCCLGGSIAIRPSPGVISFAALGPILGLATTRVIGWDSDTRFLFVVATLTALVAALLVAVPRWFRRLVFSAMIVFHFGGILTAVLSAPPQPWVTGQLWVMFYRPYLQFMYLNNAYHFYSPDPGPAVMLGFYIEYEPDEDGTRNYHWIQVPDMDRLGRPKEFTPDGKERRYPYQQFSRRLSLCEAANIATPVFPANFGQIQERRIAAGLRGVDVPGRGVVPIPLHPTHPINQQYREPNTMGKHWLSRFARHVIRNYKHPDKPHLKPQYVRAYRLVHELLRPVDFVRERPLADPTMYVPYYYGEFDIDGNLTSRTLRRRFHDDGSVEIVHRDPFLYWAIPILSVREPTEDDDGIENYLLLHAQYWKGDY
jgi:hypothetical protein